MGKVKPQTVGRYLRTCLLNMITQHFLERAVQQMRGSMVPTDGTPHLIIDNRLRLVAHTDRPLCDPATVNQLCKRRHHNSRNFHRSVFGQDYPTISYLATLFAVKRCTV